jgi:hypothetical protein
VRPQRLGLRRREPAAADDRREDQRARHAKIISHELPHDANRSALLHDAVFDLVVGQGSD